jgi:regulator of cell morphogenesis and NO signaling
METGWMDSRIDALLRTNPNLTRMFDSLGIDYCCGGSRTLRAACLEADVDVSKLEARLADLGKLDANPVPETEPGLAVLADLVEKSHHSFLKTELPRIATLADKVARVHGSGDPRLVTVQGVFNALAEELSLHLEKEERVLFPAIRDLEKGGASGGFHCGSLSGPVRVMKEDHRVANEALERLRGLTDGYESPNWACNTYQALLDGLRDLDADLAEHIRKEEEILFPRTLELERFLLDRAT